MSKAIDSIMAAKVDTILTPELCFFGSLLCNVKYNENKTAETAWTDGNQIAFNPAYVETLSHAETVGLLAHEIMHCASGHIYRRDGRDMKKWNYACDYAINDTLTAAGIILPKNSLVCPPEFKGKSAEYIYDRMPDLPPQPKGGKGGTGNGQGDPIPGEVRDSPGDAGNDLTDEQGQDSGASDKHTEGDWKELVRQAAVQAKQKGQLPASLDRFAKDAVKSKVDWKSVLRRFVEMTAKQDYSWQRASSRYAAMGIYLPSLYSEATPGIGIGQDTSGSMDDVSLAKGKAEVQAVMAEVCPEFIDLFFADSRVGHHVRFERGDDIKWEPVGGGGTDFRPVFEAIEKLDEKPVCLIYITDLYGSFPAVEPDYPVLWITDNDQVAPFGETIKID